LDSPVLYARYERHDAIALFGSESKARSLCDGQWLVFADAVVCLTLLGEPPKMSHFEKASRFCWVAGKPFRVRRHEYITFVPDEVIGNNGKTPKRPIYLFVQPPASPKYVYVGRLEPSYMQEVTQGNPDNFGKAYFHLDPTLPSEVYQDLGGYDPGDTNHAELDRLLGSLDAETSKEHRLEVLKHLVEYWHGPIGPSDGYSAEELEGIALPETLRSWFQWAGKRDGIMSGENRLLAPGESEMKDGLLVFYVENQWCYEWGTLPEGDDPPVFGREPGNRWEPEGLRLSEHLVLACMYEAITCHARYGAYNEWLPQDRIEQIVQHIPALPLNPWGWLGETRFFAHAGAFMHVMVFDNGEENGGSVMIGAKTEHPLAFLKPMIDGLWEYVSV